jgi:gas vesicle protein
MSEKVETNKGGLLLGLMIGGAVGAITSLLIAPKAGSKLRKDLWSTYRTWQDRTSQMASTLGHKTEDVVSKISEKTVDLASTVSDKTKDLTDTVKENQQRVTDSVQAAKTTFQNN